MEPGSLAKSLLNQWATGFGHTRLGKFWPLKPQRMTLVGCLFQSLSMLSAQDFEARSKLPIGLCLFPAVLAPSQRQLTFSY